MIVSRPFVRIVAFALIAAAAAACTSSDDSGPSEPPSPGAGSTSSAVTSSPAPSTSGPSATPSAGGLAAVDGGYVLAGASVDSARLYRISDGRVVKASDVTGITSVTAAGSTVVVGRETSTAETVQQLRGGRIVDLGIESGFGPAVSADGVLASVTLGASTTPGISKPGGSAIRIRSSLSRADRTLTTYPTSVSAPVWAGDSLVVAVADADGSAVRIVSFRAGRLPGRTVTKVANADDLVLTGGKNAVTVATDDGAKVVGLRDGQARPFPSGWQPLCWSGGDTVLASQGGRLASVTVPSAGSASAPQVLGRLPEGIRAFGGACGD